MVFAWSARSAKMCGAASMGCVSFRVASIDDGGVGGGGSGGGVGGGRQWCWRWWWWYWWWRRRWRWH
eukprot:563596-Lingulodinium_polyedra.AAC.1